MSFSTLFSIAKHFWPRTWFVAVFREAEQVPAVVAGLFFTSGALVIISLLAALQYSKDVQASEARMASLQTTIAKNTAELTCAKQDRSIAYLTRQLSRLEELAAARPEDQRNGLEDDITELKRKLNNAQLAYERDCL